MGFGIRFPAWRVEVKQLESGSYVFTMSQDGGVSIKEAEFEWIREGYRMRRSGSNAKHFYHSDSPGPYPFRMRVRGNDGTWSRWTQSRLVGLLSSPPVNVQYQARDAALYIRWESPVDNVEIDGYRALLMSMGERVQTLDLESSTHAVFALDDKHDKYSLHVGAVSGELGLGSLQRVDIDLSREPELRVHLFDHQPTCDPEEGLVRRRVLAGDPRRGPIQGDRRRCLDLRVDLPDREVGARLRCRPGRYTRPGRPCAID